jgi:hypothetical protein
MNKEWDRLIEVRNEYHSILGNMLASDRSTVVEFVNESLLKPNERYVALAVAESFTPDELKNIFKNLVLTASWAHAHTMTARNLVLKIPCEWVLQHIETVMEPILATGEPDEFRRMMELAWKIDRALLLRICKRAVIHPNSEIREAGEDFIEKLAV